MEEATNEEVRDAVLAMETAEAREETDIIIAEE